MRNEPKIFAWTIHLTLLIISVYSISCKTDPESLYESQFVKADIYFSRASKMDLLETSRFSSFTTPPADIKAWVDFLIVQLHTSNSKRRTAAILLAATYESNQLQSNSEANELKKNITGSGLFKIAEEYASDDEAVGANTALLWFLERQESRP